MRRTTTVLAAAALLLAACGTDDGDAGGADGTDAQARVAELEAELDEVRTELDDANTELAALRAAADDGSATAPGPDGAGPAAPQSLWSAEGLPEQLRTLFPDDADLPEDFEPGTTAWQATELPDGLDPDYPTPGALALDLARAADADNLGMDTWETTTRVLPDDADENLAYVAVLSYGYGDDAVAGRDLRITITRDGEDWTAGGAEERFHCRRGVTDDLCV